MSHFTRDARGTLVMFSLMSLPGLTVNELPGLNAKIEISTVGTGPSILTALEIEKLELADGSMLADDGLPIPAGEKPAEKCTIEVGPPGLNAIERAKAGETAANLKGRAKSQ